jgi:hypothetical protein
MTITQKRIYEVTLPNKLNNLLTIKDHTVNTLRELRTEVLNFGNEITDVLGIFESGTASIPTKDNPIGKTFGTPEQKNKIFSALKTKHQMISKEVATLLGIAPATASTILSSMCNAKLLVRTQSPNTVGRLYLYELPPDTFNVGLNQLE